MADAVLLKAKPHRWLARLRRPARSFLLPSIEAPLPTSFEVVFIGINGQPDEKEKSYYDEAANTSQAIDQAIARLLPGYISVAEGSAIQKKFIGGTSEFVETEEGYDGDTLHFGISSTKGSSGSALLAKDTRRLVGIRVSGEVDRYKVAGKDTPNYQVKTTSPSNKSIALSFSSKTMRKFILTHIVPEFERSSMYPLK